MTVLSESVPWHGRIAASVDLGQLARFGVIGIASTAAYVALYAAMRTWMEAAVANGIALVVTAVANTAANRRFTFGVSGSRGLGLDHAAGLAAFGIALAITTGSLSALSALAPAASRPVEVVVLVAANALATAIRYFILRHSITRQPPRAHVSAGNPT